MVTLVEYGDFDCIFCGEAYPVVRELPARFAPCLKVVFRHSPSTFDRPRAALAAEAAEAAAAQGRFWEMHDCLFQHPQAIDAVDLLGYAKSLGLDYDRFAEALCARSHRARVRRDQLTGVRSRVLSTPAFFINGERFFGNPDFETLGLAIDGARRRATQAPCASPFGTVDDALDCVIERTEALRDTYKRQYWHSLVLPLAGLRMTLGTHAREQTELIEWIAQTANGTERARAVIGAELPARGAEGFWHQADNARLSLARLLDAHQSVLVGAHSLSNSRLQFGNAQSLDAIARRVVATNERQAALLTERLVAERRS